MKYAGLAGATSLLLIWAGCGIDASIFTEDDVALEEENDDDGGGAVTNTSGAGGDPSGAGGARVATSVGPGGGGPSVAVSSSVVTTAVSTSSGGPTGFQLDCQGTTCPGGGTNACCWDEYGQNPAPAGECVSGPTNNDGCFTDPQQTGGFETRIECQRPSDCGPSLICCANRRFFQGNPWYDTLTCETQCDTPDVQLCEDLNDSANCPLVDVEQGPPQPGVCQPSSLLPTGYIVCGRP
ncbi:MAG: hypothetical protein AAF928_02205 [Myxococcota bacterium]